MIFVCFDCVLCGTVFCHVNFIFVSDSAMFLFTSGSRSSLSSIIRAGSQRSIEHPEIHNINSEQRINVEKFAIRPGNMDEYASLTNLLDCCVLYYYAVAHKYIIMVGELNRKQFQYNSFNIVPFSCCTSSQIADLRDSIGILSEILKETNTTHEELTKTVTALSEDSALKSIYDEVLKNLHESVENRKSVFTVC